MGRASYSRRKCLVCGEHVSAAGAAQAAHNRKHVREGRLVELYSPVLDRTEFFTPERAQAYLTGAVKNYANWIERPGQGPR